MRELTIDFNLENPLSDGCEAGYIGENNATKLIIKPSSELLGSGCSFLVAVFLSKGEIFRSEHFEPAETLEIPLGSHLTQEHYLSVQLEGYSEENMLLCKSPMISKIQFLPSISGNEGEIDADDYLLKMHIELNRENRHNHGNYDVLNLLGQIGNMLTYNGKPVYGSSEEKSVVLSVSEGEIDAMTTSGGYNILNIFSYSDIGDFIIPADAEIKSVELNIEHESCPEWIDMRDMFSYDTAHPYVLDCRKINVDPQSNLTTVCRAFFFNDTNTICTHISNMLLRNVRITYVEKSAQGAENE